MPVTIQLPDEMLTRDNGDVPRLILEQVAIDGFRSGQLTTAQVCRILGYSTRMQAQQFLSERGIPWVDYSEEEMEREVETLKRLVP